jgi:hypothetical protein
MLAVFQRLNRIWRHSDFRGVLTSQFPKFFLFPVINTKLQPGDLLRAYKPAPVVCISSPGNRNFTTSIKMSRIRLDDELFPAPSPAPSKLSPAVWPGNSLESTTALQKCLKENHEKFHIFFNDRGFHNHTSHHLLAIWALGASAPLIEAAYKINAEYQRLATVSPEDITSDNFYDHLGDPK